jgi:putative transcriptional regulator
MSQLEAARLSGISRRTLYNAESGDNPTLLTLIRLLRTYGRLGAIDDFIPVPEVSPIAVIEGRTRLG